MKGWGWSPGRARSAVSIGSSWMRAFAVLVPFMTVALLLMMLHFVGGALATAKGVLFELPEAGAGDAVATESVAMLVPMRHETLVFFDDSRYVVGSEASMRTFGERLSERFSRSDNKTLLVLADRRISCGDLMAFAAQVRRNGVEKVLFAEKSRQEVPE